jgi:hypothetical protein
MYFELTAPSQMAWQHAIWEADIMGLDPEYYEGSLTFNIGTGSIEKVSRIRDKFNLKETYTSEYEPYHPYGGINV